MLKSMVMVGLAAVGLALAGPVLKADDASKRAAAIYRATGVRGGLVVHVGCGDGRLTAALRPTSHYQVHGLDRDPGHVAAARRHVHSLGVYGEVSIDRIVGDRLPYIDNLVNLVVVESAGTVSEAEIQRVLAPRGVAYVKGDGEWRKTVKAVPKEIDEWTHYLHDATGNAVAHDTVVGPPRHLQWLGSPRWSRHHDRMASMSALVSAGGRLFYIMDEGSRVSIQMPPRWMLVARDAFNGTVLWKQPIAKWHSHLWPLKSGPTQLARRLVATDDRVFVTLGIDAPLSVLDAATGEILHTLDATKATEEFIHTESTLLALVRDGNSELADYAPKFNVGDQRRVRTEFLWNKQPRRVVAIDANSGSELWRRESIVAPLTLASDGQRVLYHDGEKIVCVDRQSGRPMWTSPPAARRSAIAFNFGPKLVIHKQVVLFAGGDRQMQAYRIDTGKLLWTAPHAQSGYQSPEDLLVAGGLVWTAPTTKTKDTGTFTGRDPLTGKVKTEFPPDVSTYWFHHRCYIAKATDRFLIPSRTGIEFVDFQAKHWDIHHWVRGGCLYGVMPCNGLLYAPPHNCACYPEAKLSGLNALAPAVKSRRPPREVDDERRFEEGPAYRDVVLEETAASDWPTYRHDAGRSGRLPVSVGDQLVPSWTARIGGRLTSPVIAAGRVYVASIDTHTLHARDAKSGRPIWTYTAGGRIDSPPTIDRGRVLFGSRDGWVYCLRATDGELAWRYRAAPRDERLTAYEQLESVWPVHGSILVQGGEAYFVAGRSMFLDGGLRFFRLDIASGRKLAEVVMDEKDPENGKNLQNRIQTLQMPVGLPDVLSTDGHYVYMRSQRIDFQGRRVELGPHSGDAAKQGSSQRGEGVHLFAPMGFLDGTYFHRAYWVFGRSFAGGHNGYHQAGKFAPAGRLLVADEDNVYGFGRKPQYYRWTTPLEHQLFAASRTPPKPPAIKPRAASVGIQFESTASLNPKGKAVVVAAWVKPQKRDGIVVARGGPTNGYALAIRNGRPRFAVRADGKLVTAVGKQTVTGRWVHLTGLLTDDKSVKLFVDGKFAAAVKTESLLTADPIQPLEIGADGGGAVGTYRPPFSLAGWIDEVRIYHGTLSLEEVGRLAGDGAVEPKSATLVLYCPFDEATAQDRSGKNNHGKLAGGVSSAPGKVGRGMRFVQRKGGAAGNKSIMRPHWTRDVPLYAQAMVLAGRTLFVAGPPDLIDEEATLERAIRRDPKLAAELARQDAALRGKDGALLWAVSATDGKPIAKYKLPALPTWDGMAAASGRLFIATADGRVVCLNGK